MFEELLQRIAEALDAEAIPYVVIGGQAVLRWGEPRLTRDIDITLGLAPGELARLQPALERARLIPLPEHPAQFVAETFVLPAEDTASGIRVDFIFSYTPFEQNTIARAVPISLGRIAVRYASPEDLLIHKVFAGRPRDLEDARAIALKQPGLDYGYVDCVLAQLQEGGDTDYLARLRELRNG